MKKYWLLIILIIQPLLDVLAFWTASENGTIAGYIRLAILAFVGIYILIKHYKNGKVWIVVAICAVVFGGHMLNAFRLGYISFLRDINYIVRVAFMPVMATFFCLEINDDNIQSQVVNGILINAIIISFVIVISYITGTYTYTYGEGLGISGWVTMDNRCCHSDILSSVCIFVAYYASKSKKISFNILLPIAIFILMITNGTRACYYTLYAITIGYAVFIIFRSLISKIRPDKNQITVVVTMLLLAGTATVIYPYTPRYQEELYKASHFSTVEKEFVEKMEGLGYDIYNMSLEEKMSDPVVHEELRTYYNAFCWGGIHQIVDRFDLDTIIYKYDGTIYSGILGNTRTMKQKYASLIMDTMDIPTHFTGFEIAQLGDDMIVDMENDYYAILYYYGYIGLAAYIFGALYIFYRIFMKLKEAFIENLTDINFALLLAFSIQLGLAFFSGAMLRRPNASIYISAVIGMLYNETKHNCSSLQC